MITLEVSNYQLKVQGHSGYAEEGSDIVCAAISVLIPTLVNTLTLNDEFVKVLENTKGSANIFFPDLESTTGRSILDGFCLTFEELANQYPINVSYQDNRRYH